MPAALEHAPRTRYNRKNVAGPGKVLRPTPLLSNAPQSGSPVGSGYTSGRAVPPVYALGESRAVQGFLDAVRLHAQSQTSGHRGIDSAADQAPRFTGHEVDVSLRDMKGSGQEISFSFPACIVRHDHHPSAGKFFDGLPNSPFEEL
jgi:hypothetical protein